MNTDILRKQNTSLTASVKQLTTENAALRAKLATMTTATAPSPPAPPVVAPFDPSLNQIDWLTMQMLAIARIVGMPSFNADGSHNTLANLVGFVQSKIDQLPKT